MPDYGNLKSYKVIDYTPAWRQQEERAAEQPPATKAIEQKTLSKGPDQPTQEINPAEDLVYEVQLSEASDTAGLGMVEVAIGSICGEEEDTPPGR